MPPGFDDELLSAYLDDELSGEQRARVDQILAEQPQRRQVLEDLQALKTTLGELPRHTLDDGFAAGVLRRAERQMLVDTQGLQTDEVGPADYPIQSRFDRLRRPLAYAGLAVAATVLIMFAFPDQNQRIVRRGAPGNIADEQPHQGVEPTVGDNGQNVAGDDAFEFPQLNAASSNGPSPDSGELPAGAAGEEFDQIDRLGGSSLESSQTTPGGGPVGGGVTASLALKTRLAEAQMVGLLVIMCEVSPEAIHSGAFEQILAGQQIEITADDQEEQGVVLLSDALTGLAAENLSSAESPNGSRNESFSRSALRELVRTGIEDVEDLVYVEAAATQLEGTLAGLAKRPDLFLHVAVEPTSGVSREQAWRGYSFGEGKSRGRVDLANKDFVDRFARTDSLSAQQPAEEEKLEGDSTRQPSSRDSDRENEARRQRKIATAADAESEAAGGRSGSVAAGRATQQPGPRKLDLAQPLSTADGRLETSARARAFSLKQKSLSKGQATYFRKSLNNAAERRQRPADDKPVATRRFAKSGKQSPLDSSSAVPSAPAQPASGIPYQRALFVFKVAAPAPSVAAPAERPAENK